MHPPGRTKNTIDYYKDSGRMGSILTSQHNLILCFFSSLRNPPSPTLSNFSISDNLKLYKRREEKKRSRYLLL